MPSSERLPTLDLFDESWRGRFIRTAQGVTDADRRLLARGVDDGSLQRLQRGVFATPVNYRYPEDRLRDAVRAYHLEHPEVTFTHRSAASLWRLPRIGDWPTRVEILVPTVDGGHGTPGVLRRRESVPADRTMVEGIPVTSLERTALDLARVDPVTSSVATLDAALRGIRLPDGGVVRADRDAMFALLKEFPSPRGLTRARWALSFADPRAELPGESLSRLQMHRLGLTPPDLQHVFIDEFGEMESDFYWFDFNVAAEFDGFGKYLLRAADPTRSAARAVIEEKRREDRIRRLPEVRDFVRWDWTVALDRPRLGRLLRDAGVR